MRKGWRTHGGEGQPCNKQCWEKWTPHPKMYPEHCLHCTQNWLKTQHSTPSPLGRLKTTVILHRGSFSKLLNLHHFFLLTFPGSSGNPAFISVDAALCYPEAKMPVSPKKPKLLSAETLTQVSLLKSCGAWGDTTPLSCPEMGLQSTRVCYLSVMWAQCHSLVSMESASHAFLTGHWTQCPLLEELLSPLNR